NPRFGELMQEGFGELAPNVVPEPAWTAGHALLNRRAYGQPIIPDREANRMTPGQRFTDPRMLAYAGSQLSGGLLDPRRLNLNPFAMDQHPHQSVYDFRQALDQAELQQIRADEHAKALGFKHAPVSPQLQWMRRAGAMIHKLEAEYHKEGVS